MASLMGVELQRTGSKRRASVVSSEPPATSPDVTHTDISSAPVALGSTEPKLPPIEAEFCPRLTGDAPAALKLHTALAVPAMSPMLSADTAPPSPYLSKCDSTTEDADKIRLEILDRPASPEAAIEAVDTVPPGPHAQLAASRSV